MLDIYISEIALYVIKINDKNMKYKHVVEYKLDADLINQMMQTGVATLRNVIRNHEFMFMFKTFE